MADWHLVNWPIRPENKLPPERKVVLVFVEGSMLPYCGYIRYAAGDINCPYFVVYRADKGAEVWAWCDCLPKGPDNTKAEFYNHNFAGRGFPKRDSDDFHDYFPTQEQSMSQIAAPMVAVAAILSSHKHLGSNDWIWNKEKGIVKDNSFERTITEAAAVSAAQKYLAEAERSFQQKANPFANSDAAMVSVAKTLNDYKHFGSSSWYWASLIQRVANKDLVPDLTPEEAIAAAVAVKQHQSSEEAGTADQPKCGNNCCQQSGCGETSSADPRQPGELLTNPVELLRAAVSGADLAHESLTTLADGFSGPEGRPARMHLDKLAETARLLHEDLKNTHIEFLEQQ